MSSNLSITMNFNVLMPIFADQADHNEEAFSKIVPKISWLVEQRAFMQAREATKKITNNGQKDVVKHEVTNLLLNKNEVEEARIWARSIKDLTTRNEALLDICQSAIAQAGNLMLLIKDASQIESSQIQTEAFKSLAKTKARQADFEGVEDIITFATEGTEDPILHAAACAFADIAKFDMASETIDQIDNDQSKSLALQYLANKLNICGHRELAKLRAKEIPSGKIRAKTLRNLFQKVKPKRRLVF